MSKFLLTCVQKVQWFYVKLQERALYLFFFFKKTNVRKTTLCDWLPSGYTATARHILWIWICEKKSYMTVSHSCVLAFLPYKWNMEKWRTEKKIANLKISSFIACEQTTKKEKSTFCLWIYICIYIYIYCVHTAYI